MDSIASQNGEASGSHDDCEDSTTLDTALSKRAIAVREKLQDDTYSWIMQCLEMIFEYFNEKSLRDQEVENLGQVVLKFCTQHLEHQRAKDVFDTLCRTHPVKNCPRGFDFTNEYERMMSKEAKVTKELVKNHPKYIKFLDRVKELERGKELSQREAISVD